LGVLVAVGVAVPVAVGVGMGVGVAVSVAVGVGVAVGGRVQVAVAVGVAVGAAVWIAVGVKVGVVAPASMVVGVSVDVRGGTHAGTNTVIAPTMPIPIMTRRPIVIIPLDLRCVDIYLFPPRSGLSFC
jgi:hypothetical protein